MSTYEDVMLKLAKMTKETNAEQMTWQEKMSGQSHQLEVKDLVAAGLNPVLSAGGNGAQSYTTSLDSGASAMANVYGAHESANATRYAAAQSAAATKYAANAQLAAARYAAQMSYAANEFGWNAKSKIQEGINQTQLKLVDKTPPSNISGLVWKMFDQSGVRDAAMKSQVAKGLTNFVKGIMNNPSAFFKQVKGDIVTDKNFILNSSGYQKVNNILSKLGLSKNTSNRNLLIRAFVFSDYKAIATLGRKLPGTISAWTK